MWQRAESNLAGRGPPIQSDGSLTGRSGSLATAHHIEALAEFVKVGDAHPISLTARLIDDFGATMMEIESQGPVGTALWTTGPFVWDGDEIVDWDWALFTAESYPVDRMTSYNRLEVFHPDQVAGKFHFEEQAIKGEDAGAVYGIGDATVYGFGVTAPGTWRRAPPDAGPRLWPLGRLAPPLAWWRALGRSAVGRRA